MKKKKNEKEENDDEDQKDFDFEMNDEFFEQFNSMMDQFKDQLPDQFKQFSNFDFSSDFFKDLVKKMMKNMDPETMAKMMDPENNPEFQPENLMKTLKDGKFGANSPFSFGFNMAFGPDGKPIMNPSKNIQRKTRPQIKKTPPPEQELLVDIFEEEGNQIVVVCEVPDVEKKDIQLQASGKELEISAENTLSGKKFHKVIPLPKEINPNYAKARYQNGILEVRLEALPEEQQKKRINIE